MGFQSSIVDPSLFIYNSGGFQCFLLIYVDDVVLISNNVHRLQQLITTLSSSFSLRDLGKLNFFLGIQVYRNSDGILLSQNSYISDIIQSAGMGTCKPANTSMASGVVYNKIDGMPLSSAEATLYRKIDGSLQYLTITRLDLSFFVN